MADNGRLTIEQRAKTAIFYAESKSVITTQRKFRAVFHTRWAPTRKTILRLYDKFEKGDSVKEEKRPRASSVRSPENIEALRIAMECSPGKSIRQISREVGISCRTIYRILNSDHMLQVKERESPVQKRMKSSTKAVMEMPVTEAEADSSDETVSKFQEEYGNGSRAITVKCEPTYEEIHVKSDGESRYGNRDALATDSQEDITNETMIKSEVEETSWEISDVKEELKKELTTEEPDMILPDNATCEEGDPDSIQNINIESRFKLKNEDINFVQHDEKEGNKEKTKCNNDNVTSTLENVVNKEDEQIFKCDVCGKVLANKSRLVRHNSVHTGEKPFKCDACGKSFSLRGYLVQHRQIHTAEKPFVCVTCGKGFRRRGGLATHILTHTGEKTFKCNVCGNEFSQRNHLVSHTRTHTREKPFKCNTCGKEFTARRGLIVHARTHTGEKPYKCDTCGRLFRERTVLLIHTRVHTGEKPFICNVCGKCFSQQESVIAHSRVHTGEKPFKCIICGRGFSQRGSLYQHSKIHTKVK